GAGLGTQLGGSRAEACGGKGCEALAGARRTGGCNTQRVPFLPVGLRNAQRPRARQACPRTQPDVQARFAQRQPVCSRSRDGVGGRSCRAACAPGGGDDSRLPGRRWRVGQGLSRWPLRPGTGGGRSRRLAAYALPVRLRRAQIPLWLRRPRANRSQPLSPYRPAETGPRDHPPRTERLSGHRLLPLIANSGTSIGGPSDLHWPEPPGDTATGKMPALRFPYNAGLRRILLTRQSMCSFRSRLRLWCYRAAIDISLAPTLSSLSGQNVEYAQKNLTTF